MKALLRAFPLWATLATASWLLAGAVRGEMTQVLTACAVFLLPPLAVWLTVRAAASLPEHCFWRVPFWAVTTAGWFTLLVVAQGRVESHADEQQNILLAFGFTSVFAIWLAVKGRSLPTWRGLREGTASVAILALGCGAFAWCYDTKTRSIAGRAEARWSEIGLPIPEFEKTLAPSRENAGSEVVRQVLREHVSSRFYKDGTPAAAREPAIERSKATLEIVTRACEIIAAKLPPADDLDLSSQPVAAIEPLAAALEADYRRILAVEPPIWASNPHDSYWIDVPNFLGVRMFSQLTAADAMRRLSIGDEEGAARALAAGLRLREGLRKNPTLASLMIDIAVDGLLASKQVRLPAVKGGLESVARDAGILRAELLRRLQLEAWACLRFADQFPEAEMASGYTARFLPKWLKQIAKRPATRRQFAVAALNNAEYAAIQKSPATLALPDLGMSLQEAVSTARPCNMDVNAGRAAMRIHATLLLREQTELIRDARARLAAGRPVESRDSAVLPGVRWELTADIEKNTVATRLAGAPEWIVKKVLTTDEFWLLPLDGSIGWQFRLPPRTASR